MFKSTASQTVCTYDVHCTLLNLNVDLYDTFNNYLSILPQLNVKRSSNLAAYVCERTYVAYVHKAHIIIYFLYKYACIHKYTHSCIHGCMHT